MLPASGAASGGTARSRRAPVVAVLGAGAVAVGLAALPYKAFELDRFFVPKDVALQVVAAAALVAVGGARARTPGTPDAPGLDRSRDPVDLALTAFLLASVAGAAVAPSGWLAAHAVGVSGAGVALFWAARAAAAAGHRAAVLWAAALLPVVAVVTALAQAYGVGSEYFSLNRAPGGTFGNRNFVAHLCAVGLPLLGYLAVRARRAPEAATATAAFAAAAATLVLTRSRGAWLAAAVAAAPFAVGLLRAASARRALAGRAPTPGRIRAGRAVLLAAAAAAAALAAVRLPNALNWRSESPYLDSARGVVNYRAGSGEGRLKQWRNSARLMARAPLLGVGPGNWPVRYPAVAPARDPSLTTDRTTANPWPSSDWVAFVSERGLLGAGALAVAFALLFWRAHRLVWRDASAEARLRGGTLGAVLAATVTAGAFDAVLLLAAPTFLAWTAAGALAFGGAGEDTSEGATGRPSVGAAGRRPGAPRLLSPVLVGALAASAAVGLARAGAMRLFSSGRAGMIGQAALLAPGDYRIQLRAAQVAQQAGRCDEARRRAGAARALAPAAAAPGRVLRACGGGRVVSGSRGPR